MMRCRHPGQRWMLVWPRNHGGHLCEKRTVTSELRKVLRAHPSTPYSAVTAALPQTSTVTVATTDMWSGKRRTQFQALTLLRVSFIYNSWEYKQRQRWEGTKTKKNLNWEERTKQTWSHETQKKKSLGWGVKHFSHWKYGIEMKGINFQVFPNLVY